MTGPRRDIDREIIRAIEAAIESRDGRAERGELRFLCPAHDDHHPSARWNGTKAVWHCDVCGAGGGALDLARRLGISVAATEPEGLTIAQLADAKGLPVEYLRSLGISEGIAGTERTRCVDIPYLSEHSEIESLRKRLRLQGEPRFIWRRGDKVLPYGLWRLAEARAAGRIVLVEGESDTWTLWHSQFPALGLPGASTWKESWRPYLQSIAEIYVWRESDQGGDALVAALASDLPDVRIIDAPPEAKDPNALWIVLERDVVAFRGRMEALLASARRASDMRAEALSQEARELYKIAGPLLEDPHLMERIGKAIRANGYAGDLHTPEIVYLALTSRLLERPMNLALIAQSSAGKNKAVDAALDLTPPEAYHLEKAGSARALVYSDADFAHKTVVVAEADSIPEDGPAASAVRSLASDNVMSYDVVEKGEDGKHVTRRIDKPGPTGLITTSTKPLSEQMNTRVLSVSVDDTPGQTRAVLHAHADSVEGDRPSLDLGPFIALQCWLQLAGDHSVTIPFAHALADLVPDGLVRMRRDFRQLLTVIQAVALLYQRQRDRDGQSRVIATLDDYAIAREILLDTFAAAARGGVTKTVRETVEALHDLYKDNNPVTITQIGDRLKLARDTAWHRVRRTISLGYIVNQETRKGQPAKLIPGDQLPEEQDVLPSVEILKMHMCAADAETHPTVQPDERVGIEPQSEPAVESAVESAIQPDFQPRLPLDPDSKSPPEAAAVERLNENPGAQHTSTTTDEADAVYVFALAEELGFPRLLIRPGETVIPGRDAWQRFVRNPAPGRLLDAMNALEQLCGDRGNRP